MASSSAKPEMINTLTSGRCAWTSRASSAPVMPAIRWSVTTSVRRGSEMDASAAWAELASMTV